MNNFGVLDETSLWHTDSSSFNMMSCNKFSENLNKTNNVAAKTLKQQ